MNPSNLFSQPQHLRIEVNFADLYFQRSSLLPFINKLAQHKTIFLIKLKLLYKKFFSNMNIWLQL
ncbi:hypothetical protein Avbf_09917 [Armadillidium vulgare]|nr:hypothetical protein Avbf_09917 [Armadillidium vulgare]